MLEKVSKAAYMLTHEIHEKIDEVYEDISDGLNEEAGKKIVEAISLLKILKGNVLVKQSQDEV